MSSLPEALVQFRTDLEKAIGREHAVRLRKRRRQRYVIVTTAALLVAVGTASAFGTVREYFAEPVAKPIAPGKLTRTVGGVRFSLYPKTGWGPGPVEKVGDKFRTHGLLISKSTRGPQTAEAMIYWAGFKGGGEATRCTKVLPSAANRSRAALAAAVASAPGTKLAGGPWQVILGGHPTTRVVVRVRKDLGCEPGFFFTWPHDPAVSNWGAFWPGTDVGDSIRVWIVDVEGKRLFFAAVTKPGHGVEHEIVEIVKSIRFGFASHAERDSP